MIPKEEGPNASSKVPNGTEAAKYIRKYRKETGHFLEADTA